MLFARGGVSTSFKAHAGIRDARGPRSHSCTAYEEFASPSVYVLAVSAVAACIAHCSRDRLIQDRLRSRMEDAPRRALASLTLCTTLLCSSPVSRAERLLSHAACVGEWDACTAYCTSSAGRGDSLLRIRGGQLLVCHPSARSRGTERREAHRTPARSVVCAQHNQPHAP